MTSNVVGTLMFTAFVFVSILVVGPGGLTGLATSTWTVYAPLTVPLGIVTLIESLFPEPLVRVLVLKATTVEAGEHAGEEQTLAVPVVVPLALVEYVNDIVIAFGKEFMFAGLALVGEVIETAVTLSVKAVWAAYPDV
jgi:hypothetical protein